MSKLEAGKGTVLDSERARRLKRLDTIRQGVERLMQDVWEREAQRAQRWDRIYDRSPPAGRRGIAGRPHGQTSAAKRARAAKAPVAGACRFFVPHNEPG
jgi:hypothetical protein